MHVTLVHIMVKPEHVNDFVAATRINHENSINELGNRRFDVLQSTEQPSHFVLYEAYASETDAIAHKSTPHYSNWRDTVAPWMAQPRRGELFSGIFPE